MYGKGWQISSFFFAIGGRSSFSACTRALFGQGSLLFLAVAFSVKVLSSHKPLRCPQELLLGTLSNHTAITFIRHCLCHTTGV